MSGGKIDLGKIERDVWDLEVMNPNDVLALVAAVRAARALSNGGWHVADRMALDAALSPFTDTAQGAVQPDSAESDKRGAQGAEQREGRCDGE